MSIYIHTFKLILMTRMTNRRTLTVMSILFTQVIVSSPGSPSSEESEPSPEPINKGVLGSLGPFEKGCGITAATTTMMTATTTMPTRTTMATLSNSVDAVAGSVIEQVTPTSSVDTEESNVHAEEGERDVEGDAEASDDDRHQH